LRFQTVKVGPTVVGLPLVFFAIVTDLSVDI